ncbi:hypothetical protein HGRIS_000456 [Hohenbuehelia grisea]|uniref:Glutamine synthetase n=1 Tax=Hohenbuehelia grisea TaxID=104357 RepID=A0ABR3JRW4_9AGAR
MDSTPLGVQYTPSNAVSTAKALSIHDLKDHQILFVRVHWVDLANNIRYRVLPIEYFEKVMKSPRPSISFARIALGLVFLTVAEGFSASGEFLYVPDLDTLKICPYAPGHASVLGWFEEKFPRPDCDQAIAYRAEICPRTLLHNVLREAKSLGIEFLVGFETEFILLKSTSPIEAVNHHGWSNSPALPTGAVETQVLEEIVLGLKASGIEVQMYHAEAAPGQYEIVTAPRTPLEAADALIHTRETIFNIASKYKLRATLAPRVFSDSCKHTPPKARRLSLIHMRRHRR